ncbi:MAG: hypothetical protein AAF617_02925 [Bacteroidota bacterium]
MKKYVAIILLLFCIQITVGQSQAEKQKEIEFFKFEMQQLNDSSERCFDKGIKLLKEGESPKEIATLISPELAKWEVEIEEKLIAFKIVAKKLKFTEEELADIFRELKAIFKSTQEKYKYLKENGVQINSF